MHCLGRGGGGGCLALSFSYPSPVSSCIRGSILPVGKFFFKEIEAPFTSQFNKETIDPSSFFHSGIFIMHASACMNQDWNDSPMKKSFLFTLPNVPLLRHSPLCEIHWIQLPFCKMMSHHTIAHEAIWNPISGYDIQVFGFLVFFLELIHLWTRLCFYSIWLFPWCNNAATSRRKKNFFSCAMRSMPVMVGILTYGNGRCMILDFIVSLVKCEVSSDLQKQLCLVRALVILVWNAICFPLLSSLYTCILYAREEVTSSSFVYYPVQHTSHTFIYCVSGSLTSSSFVCITPQQGGGE